MSRSPLSRSQLLSTRVYLTAVAVLAAVVVLVAALLAFLPGSSGSSGTAVAAETTPPAAVNAFLKGYMNPDGRVVRRDQGGDTVSEGQAYAMLMAAATGERRPFALAWGWAKAHLLQPDGLMAWRWSGGAVAGKQPATDADLGAAAALVMAAHRFSDGAYLADAHRMADAILAHESVTTRAGTTLVAGPWARRPTAYVDPSYLSAAEIHQLVDAFGGRWNGIAYTVTAELESLARNRSLIPDWTVVGAGGTLRPTPRPGSTGAKVRYGFDAARAPIWMASSCNAGLRAAAASLGPKLRREHGMVDLTLNGRPDPGVSHPVGTLAEAAADIAAGRAPAAWGLVRQAIVANRAHPTYYGSAWIALSVLAFDHILEPCS